MPLSFNLREMNELIIHLIAHTHWDREWYSSFEVMRLRLARMIDLLISILDTCPEYVYFTLDGQTVILDDYLEVRPEMEEKLLKYVKEGRVLIGPWYTLPDEFLVSGEALIRNLLFGHRMARDFGKVMKVGYLPDMFGHISQLPQILLGFDINSAILWRGIEGTKAEYLLRGPDGSEVLTCRLDPRLGYIKGFDISVEKEGILNFVREETKRSSSRHLLFMYGTDHVYPDPDLPSLIEDVNKSLSGIRIIQSNLPDYLNSLREDIEDVGTIYGEQRCGIKFAPILPGVLSSRVYLKQKNESIQKFLERWVEPFSAVAFMLGNSYERGCLRKAWEYLLQNHAHDSICGCSIDDVHRDMEKRFEWAEDICNNLISESLEFIVQNISLSQGSIVVFNPLNWTTCGYVEAVIETTDGAEFLLTDGKKLIPYEIKEKKSVEKLILTPYAHIEKTERLKIGFKAEDVPPIGLRAYLIREGMMPPFIRFKSGNNWAENENLIIAIEKNGTITLTDKETDEVYHNLNYFEDSGDNGDEYNYSPTHDNLSLNTLSSDAEIRKEVSPLLIRFRIKKKFPVPIGLNRKRERSRKVVNLPIESVIRFTDHSKRVEIETRIINRAKNHRLRVIFPTGIGVRSFLTGSKFDIIERKPGRFLPKESWVEMPSATFPTDNFIDLSIGNRGLAVLTDGLKEGEIVENSVIALTLLRCIGELSRDDLRTRKGHAGFPIPTPDAQCIGVYTFSYALLPHSEKLGGEDILRESMEYSAELRSVYNGKRSNGILPGRFSFFQITPTGIFLSSLKVAEDSNRIVLRVYNPTEERIDCEVKPFRSPKKVSLANLNEEIVKEIKFSNGVIPISIEGKKIVTILLNMGEC